MASSRWMRRLAALAGLLVTLTVSAAAEAAIPNIPNGAGGDIACTVQTGANAGERWCSGIFTTFDGAPIDINVGFPPAPASGPDGDFPIVGVFHGWGGSKLGARRRGGWIDDGYAFFSMSDRGWGNSCGGTDPKRLQPVCANGYNHLMDTRFEVRDAQEVFEALADRAADGATGGEGLIDPQAIGVTGGSYGGGISMALGALKNRKMVQAGDGTLVPWVSDGGKPMRIAAAQPDIPWTDLAYSLQPNGHTLDYVADAPYLQRGRIGVMKQSFVAGLYATGPGAEQLRAARHRPRRRPDHLVRGDQRRRALRPEPALAGHRRRDHHAPLVLLHRRLDGAGADADLERLDRRPLPARRGDPLLQPHAHQPPGHADLADLQRPRPPARAEQGPRRHLPQPRSCTTGSTTTSRATGPQPFQGVQTLTQTCGGPSGGATGAFDDPNTDLPFQAPTWAELAPGRGPASTAPPRKTIAPEVSDQAGPGLRPDRAAAAPARPRPAPTRPARRATASTRRPAGGFTLMGSPTIVADINSPGADVAGRGPAARRRPGDRQRDARRARALPAGDQLGHDADAPGLPAPPERLEVRRPATSPSSSCCRPTSPTAATRTARRRSPSRTSSCACRCSSSPARRAGSWRAPAPKVVPAGYELAARLPARRLSAPDRRVAGQRLARAGLRGSARTRTATHGPPLAFGVVHPRRTRRRRT